jgi:enoyl-[acyl-carrier-protein] reductase (NADH)
LFALARHPVLVPRLVEIPISHSIQPDDRSNLVLFLYSDAASAITGQAIAIGAGFGRSTSY